MPNITRRRVLGWGAGLAGAALTGRVFRTTPAYAQGGYGGAFKPEQGASLRLLRWSGFVKSDEEVWNANTKKFTDATGVGVTVEYITWEDVRPKAALAANLGTGPDLVMGWYDDPHIYPNSLIDVSDLAEGLGKRLGGWYDVARTYGYSQAQRRWIAVPVGSPIGCLNYRVSWVKEAGFDSVPDTLDGFLKLAKAMKAKGHPVAFPLGRAVGDGNVWTHWLLWSFGGMAVDKDSKTIIINRQGTWDALEYAKALYAEFAPGAAGWLDPNNNRAFLAGEVSITNNGISIYYAAKKDFPQIAEDMDHVAFPKGKSGRHTELHLFTQAFIFRHSNYPNAAKAYVDFMLDAPQANPWVEAMNGYVTPALKVYKQNPVWTRDPKATPFRDGLDRALHNGFAGAPGREAAAALADFIVLDMFADATANAMSPRDAARRAETRLRRIYR